MAPGGLCRFPRKRIVCFVAFAFLVLSVVGCFANPILLSADALQPAVLTHMWVQWTTASATYILDPTINWTAQTVDQVAGNSYVPYYAYAGYQKYRAPAASTLYARL